MSYPIRLAFVVCKLLVQYLQFISNMEVKNVQLVRRSLRKGKGEKKNLKKQNKVHREKGTLCTSVVYRIFAPSTYKVS